MSKAAILIDAFHLLIDINKDMKKKYLRMAAKLTNGENVRTAILLKICAALRCDMADIIEVVPDGSPASEECPQERM